MIVLTFNFISFLFQFPLLILLWVIQFRLYTHLSINNKG
nr:MAG TPA: hypothetical protein [Caudoviricetes sp.]